ncbi:protein translocase subunit SecF [Geochorda subterranea]|uniref:Protein-export membrane protein SecF n=1 Tax=Geochorda subterranea TaxID=3109564 RepID=A0ABZ1BKZ6_9FIRM|nr:protein translocase subunit SecF [Limnochorda sp. LNt]WRP13496.1 protein translocase subunit SecF [Limnochorda sp. LNt]
MRGARAAAAPAGAAVDRPARHVYDLMRYRAIYLIIASVVMALALSSLVIRGFNLGIDFTGGTLLERALPSPVTAQEVQEVLGGEALADLRLGGVSVQPLDGGRAVLIRTRPLSQAEVQRIDAALEARFGEVVDRRTEVVGPVVGRELVSQALFALLLAIGGILVYVTLRYEHRFGISAIVALLHDALVVAGLYSFLQLEVNVSTVAVLLTVLGYSVNDTIVIFDRIRERLAQSRRRRDFDRLANEAIIETLPRTINTSGSTLAVVLAILLLGGPTLRDFSLGLFVGLLAGTYSTVFVAAALWVMWRTADERRRAAHVSEAA